MSAGPRKLKVAFVHPDLGIGGAERLVVDAALGLQRLGHTVDIYTSHHDPNHCFEETRDGTLRVHHIKPTFPRSIRGKGHVLFANLRQMQLCVVLLAERESYDVYFVDQLPTCVGMLRGIGGKPVVFYGHFPDKLLADGEFIEGRTGLERRYTLKGLYRWPMDWIEEVSTARAHILLVNSHFTAHVFRQYFPSAGLSPRVVYPGINTQAYDVPVSRDREVIGDVFSDRPTLVSLNRFEKKKNAALAVEAFALVRQGLTSEDKARGLDKLRLVLAGGYDPRLKDNIDTLKRLTSLCDDLSLTYSIIPPPPSTSFAQEPDVTFLLNFTTEQRTWLLKSPTTLALLYTPANEHFGIIPVEAMISRLPVVACDSGGPTETIVDPDVSQTLEARTGWLLPPNAAAWSKAILEILRLPDRERCALGERARKRSIELFSLDAMAKNIEDALQRAVRTYKPDRTVFGWIDVVACVIIIGIVVKLWKSR